MGKKRQLKPIREYLNDKGELIEQMFASIPIVEVKNMVPINLQGMPLHELKAECLVELLAMSNGEILSILTGKKRRTVTTSESEESFVVLSDEEVRQEHSFQKKEKRIERRGKEQHSDGSSPEPSQKEQKKKKRKSNEVELKNKKKKKGSERDPSLPSTSKNVVSIKESSRSKKKGEDKVSKDKPKNKKQNEEPEDDDVVIIEDDEIEGSTAKKEEKSLLDLLELEMRARAIKALLKTEDDKEKRKRLEEYRDEPDDLIPVVEEPPQIELLSDSDDEAAKERREIAKNIQIQVDGDSLSVQDVEVLDSLLGIGGKETINPAESIDISDDASTDLLDVNQKSPKECSQSCGKVGVLSDRVEGGNAKQMEDIAGFKLDMAEKTVERDVNKAEDCGSRQVEFSREIPMQDGVDHSVVSCRTKDSELFSPSSKLGSSQNVEPSREVTAPRSDYVVESTIDGTMRESRLEIGQLAVVETSEHDKGAEAAIQTDDKHEELINSAEIQCEADRAEVAQCNNFLVNSSNVSRDVTTDDSIQSNVSTTAVDVVSEKEEGGALFEEELLDYDYNPSEIKETSTLAVAVCYPSPCPGSERNDAYGSSICSPSIHRCTDETVSPVCESTLVENICVEETKVIERGKEDVLQLEQWTVDVKSHKLGGGSEDKPCHAVDVMIFNQGGNIEDNSLAEARLSLSNALPSEHPCEVDFITESSKSRYSTTAPCNKLSGSEPADIEIENILVDKSSCEVVAKTQDGEGLVIGESDKKDSYVLLTDSFKTPETESLKSIIRTPETRKRESAQPIRVDCEMTEASGNGISKENNFKGVDEQRSIPNEAVRIHEPGFVEDSVHCAIMSHHNLGSPKVVLGDCHNDLEIVSAKENLSPGDVTPFDDHQPSLKVEVDLSTKSPLNKGDGVQVVQFGVAVVESPIVGLSAPYQPSSSLVLASNIEEGDVLSEPGFVSATEANSGANDGAEELTDVSIDAPKTADEPCSKDETLVPYKFKVAHTSPNGLPDGEIVPQNSVSRAPKSPAVVLGPFSDPENLVWELAAKRNESEDSTLPIENSETTPVLAYDPQPTLEPNVEVIGMEYAQQEAEEPTENHSQDEIIEVSSPISDESCDGGESQEVVVTVNSDSSESEPEEEEGEINSSESVVEVQSSEDELANPMGSSSVRRKSPLLKKRSLRNHQVPEPLALETITIEDDEVVNTLVQQVPIEILELDDSDDEKSSWTARWLESDNVKKVVKTSKMMMNLRKKLMSLKKSKIAQQAEEPKLPPTVDCTPKLIGSVEEYYRLVRDGVIMASKAGETDSGAKTGEAVEILKSSAKAVEASEPPKSSLNVAEGYCEDPSNKSAVDSRSGISGSSTSVLKGNDEVKPNGQDRAPQTATTFHDSGLEDISDAEEKEDGELSDSDEGLLDDQQDSSKSMLTTCEAVPTVNQIPLPSTVDKGLQRTEIEGNAKTIQAKIGNIVKAQKKKKPRRSRKDIQKIYNSLGPRAFKGAKTPPAKKRVIKKKKNKKPRHPGLGSAPIGGAVSSNTVIDSYAGSSVTATSTPINPVQAVEGSNVFQGSNVYGAAAGASQMSASNPTMHHTYQAWLYSQGNYGYGTPEAAAQDPNVYKQWEEYYRSLMEACRASAAQLSATKGYDWVFDPSKLVTPSPQGEPPSQPATTPTAPMENLPVPVTQGDGNYQYRYGLKGLLKEHFIGSNTLGQSSCSKKN